MVRRLVFGGVLALALVASSSAFAADLPRATLVTKADKICAADNVAVKHFKHKAPNTDTLFTSTPKQLKASAGWWAELAALAKHESDSIFALGTPREPAARTAWNRWHVLTTSYGLPFMTAAVSAVRRGDLQALKSAFAKGDKQDAEAAKLIKSLGLKVCEFI